MADKPKHEKPTPHFSLTQFLWGVGIGALGVYAYTKQMQSTVTGLLPTSASAPPAATTAPVTTQEPPPVPAPSRAVSVTHTVTNNRAGATDFRAGDEVTVSATAVTTNGAPAQYSMVVTHPDGTVYASDFAAAADGRTILNAPGIWKIHVDARVPPSSTSDATRVSSTEAPVEVRPVVVAPATGAAGSVMLGYRR